MREMRAGETCLKLLLTSAQRSGNLIVTCVGTKRIQGPIDWEGSHLTVEPVRLPDGDAGVAVRDAGADVEIVSHSVEAHENLRLW